MELNKKESELKILQMEEDQAMKREKHELEIQILKNQISKWYESFLALAIFFNMFSLNVLSSIKIY